MKIHILADTHLTHSGEAPEWSAALKNIIFQQHTKPGHMVIAGDVFDVTSQNYSEFEAICKAYPDTHFMVIPGNHDPAISGSQIVAPNVTIYSHPTVQVLDEDGPVFFFLPYEKNKTMGERIAEHASKLQPGEWILVAHGDYLDGLRDVNPYESGLYMTHSTRKDIETFKPKKVFRRAYPRAYGQPTSVFYRLSLRIGYHRNRSQALPDL